jgi:hypothetical protein
MTDLRICASTHDGRIKPKPLDSCPDSFGRSYCRTAEELSLI